jgi:hypothetical protein
VLARGRAPALKAERIEAEVASSIAAALSFAHWEVRNLEVLTTGIDSDVARLLKPHDLIEAVQPEKTSLQRIFGLELAVFRYQGVILAHQKRLHDAYIAERYEHFASQKLSAADRCRRIKAAHLPPLSRLRQGEGASAPIVVQPLKVDAIVRDVMGKIYAGNRGAAEKRLAAGAFMRAYGGFFQKSAEFPLGPITADDIIAAIGAMPDNTPGLDSVVKDDLACSGYEAAGWLARLFMAIEGGAPWPSATLLVRTAFLSKQEDDLSPTGYRGLSILSKIYRLYAVIRLRHLLAWVRSWQHEDLFAGTSASVGAEDAWYIAALELEVDKLHGAPITGGSKSGSSGHTFYMGYSQRTTI